MTLLAWPFLGALPVVVLPVGGNELRPGPAAASEGGDETLVTARKHSERLADLPLSVSAVDARDLEDFRIVEVSDLVSRVPNLTFSEFSARRLSFPFVRGVGSGSGDPTVITYVDDVPQFGFGGTNLPLFDLERVEILRGPQGTLYGKNAMGGVIHLHGRRPSDERRMDLGATFGSDDLHEYSGVYSGPLGGSLRGDLALLSSERDGFTKNDFPDADPGNPVDDRDGLFGRGRILWNPNDDSEVDFSMFGERARDGGFVLSDLVGLRAKPHHINQDFEGLTNRDVLQPGVVYRAFGEELDFTSISSWQSWDVVETSDFDFSPIDGVRRRSDEDQDYYYQELRLGTQAPQGGRARETRWLVGASGFLSDAERQAANIFRPGGAGIFFPPGSEGTDLNHGEFDDFGLALFGEVGVPVGELFELGAGLRYDREDKEVERVHTFDPGGGPIVLGQGDDDRTDDELAPSFNASFHPSAVTLVYLRAAKGWKSGGFNLSAPVGQEEFGPETIWSYEIGWRRSFDEEHYALGAVAFYNDLQDMQLSLFDPVAGGFTDNAGEAASRGVELEGRAELAEGLSGFATLGLLDSEFDEYTDNFGNNEGNDLPFAPEHTWSLGLQYGGEMPSGALWNLSGDYARMGDFFYDAGNREGDSFGLANLRLGVDSPSYGVAMWVRNAFDEEYEPVAFQPSPVNPNLFVGESGAPRVLGFTLSIHL